MNKLLHMSVSPHVHCGRSTADIMRDVVVALLPVAGAGIIIFGLRALLVIAVCVASCVGFEALFNYIVKKEQTIGDFSAVITGLLLALNLPANIPLWQCVVGAAFAIIVVKCLFGGLGYNVVNPAVTAKVFMLVSFTGAGAAAQSIFSNGDVTDTPLVQIAKGEAVDTMSLLWGTHAGTIGETCAVALIFGFLYLLLTGVITWHIPVTFVGSVFVFSYLLEGDAMTALSLTLSGGLLISAIFMATDCVTSPTTAWGKVIFGLGCGLLTFLIRFAGAPVVIDGATKTFGLYTEGAAFAILLMNILTPYIDKLTAHKVYGGKKA